MGPSAWFTILQSLNSWIHVALNHTLLLPYFPSHLASCDFPNRLYINTFDPDTLLAGWAWDAMRLLNRDSIIYCHVEQWLQTDVTFPKKENAQVKEGTWHQLE